MANTALRCDSRKILASRDFLAHTQVPMQMTAYCKDASSTVVILSLPVIKISRGKLGKCQGCPSCISIAVNTQLRECQKRSVCNGYIWFACIYDMGVIRNHIVYFVTLYETYAYLIIYIILWSIYIYNYICPSSVSYRILYTLFDIYFIAPGAPKS